MSLLNHYPDLDPNLEEVPNKAGHRREVDTTEHERNSELPCLIPSIEAREAS